MKLVIAVISPDKLDAVRGALPEPDAYIYYVNLVGDVHDPVRNSYRGGSYLEPRGRLRVEIIVVNEMLLDEVIRAVALAASSELGHGFHSGNIFVLPLEKWIRIPDGQAGPALQPELKENIKL
jgi:nitrogen regulatory protein PII